MELKINKSCKSITSIFITIIMTFELVFNVCTAASNLIVTDIEGHWASKVINKWIEEGLTSGYPDGTFRPEKPITRAEFATLVNKAFKYSEEGEGFVDVSKNDWYYKEISKAKKAGYLNGYENGTVRPQANIKRQEVAVIIAKIKGLQQDKVDVQSFSDAITFADWCKGFIVAVANRNYMKGYDNGNFEPLRLITRAEAIASLNNVLSQNDISDMGKGSSTNKTLGSANNKGNENTDDLKIESLSDQRLAVYEGSTVLLNSVPDGASISILNSNEKAITAFISGKTIYLRGLKTGKSLITVSYKKNGGIIKVAYFNVIVEENANRLNVTSAPIALATATVAPITTTPTPYNPVYQTYIPTYTPYYYQTPSPTNTPMPAYTNTPTPASTQIATPTLSPTSIVQVTPTPTPTNNNSTTASPNSQLQNITNTPMPTVNTTPMPLTTVTPNQSQVPLIGSAVIAVSFSELIPNIKKITVKAGNIGGKFKVEGSELIKDFSQDIIFATSEKNINLYILSIDGNKVLATVLVNLDVNSEKGYNFTVTGQEGLSNANFNADISVNVSQIIPTLKEISVKTANMGAFFKVEGSDVIKKFSEKVAIISTELTRMVYILDADSQTVLRNIIIDVSSNSDKEYQINSDTTNNAIFKKARVSVNIAGLIPSLKEITLMNTGLGEKFKVEGSDLIKPIGEKIVITTLEENRTLTILASDGITIIGTVIIDVKSNNVSDYILN